MSARLRITIALILVSLIPIVLIAYIAQRYIADFQTLVTDTNQSIISQTPSEEIAQLLNTLDSKLQTQIQDNNIRFYLVIGVVTMVAVVIGIIVGSSITAPILKMVQAADRATQGHLEAFQPSDDPSELGSLSRSIYAMAIQLTEGMENLEQQATERTREMSRRNDQLEVAAQIGREVSTILDVDLLLDEVSQLISERFGYYHVAIFFVDDVGEYAVLRSTNSRGGRNLLALGHKLKIGEKGIVGYVAGHGKARVAYDVESDQVFYKNPELPETRSEAALPIRIRDRVVGVLDIQSISLSAFSLDDMRVLQIVADQVALAIENTRLFAENRRIRKDLEQAYGQRIVGSWARRLKNAPVTYVFNRLGVETSDTQLPSAESEAYLKEPQIDSETNQLTVPIFVREQVIGSLVLRREIGFAGWTEDDLLLVEDVLEQIEPALESARLLEETQIRAMQEQAVNEISTQVRRSAGMDEILQNTVRELGKALGSSRAFIQLAIQAGDELPG